MTSEADTLERWFAIADANHDGRIEGAEAISFFQKSGLPRETLKEVTMLADTLFVEPLRRFGEGLLDQIPL